MTATTNEAPPPLLRPTPRRPYDLPGDSPSTPESEFPGTFNWIDPDAPPSGASTPPLGDRPRRSKSAISLTASTLFGIYSPSYNDSDLQTPDLSRHSSVLNIPEANGDYYYRKPKSFPMRSKRYAQQNKRKAPETYSMLTMRVLALFIFGMLYGIIVTHLHNSKNFSPVTVELDRNNPEYLALWGLAGVILGSILPWLDGEDEDEDATSKASKTDWSPAVRSVGAFVGIAYAIRRLPWESTLQVSATFALVNPFLWNAIDRTRAGFWFSALVGITGTVFLLQTNPDIIPPPEVLHNETTMKLVAGLISQETIGVSTWIASVLFCSCVCFGNVGRKLTREL